MVRLFELAARRRLALTSLLVPLALAPAVVGSCYSTGNGTPPPPATFYFPVGMITSRGGNVLYVVNSDFDLQWNGGTVQSYDLHLIRQHAAISAAGYALSSSLPLPEGGGASMFFEGGKAPATPTNLCATGVTAFLSDGGFVSSCAPFINSSFYVRDSVTIGAFATDLQLSPWGTRLYAPVRGDASLTWLAVVADFTPDPTDPTKNTYPAPLDSPADTQLACDADGGGSSCYRPFTLQCGQGANGGRCDATHHAGVNANEPGNTRNLTMPGEPFAMAQTPDGTAIVITHQTEGDTSLFLTGFNADGGGANPSTPSMQFIVDAGLPMGGDGIATVPHDPYAYGCTPAEVAANACPAFPKPAFLETNNTVADLNLLRYYSDDGTTVFPDAAVPDANLQLTTTLQRPFLEVERTIAISALSIGTDSRGIVFDTSARLKCEHLYPYPNALNEQCARMPARTFIANRQPDSLLIGTTGGVPFADPATFDADAVSLNAAPAPLEAGPSRVYLAPIVDADGDYVLRVFVVCFNGNSIEIVNPDTGAIEANISVGAGPFAMAFDPYEPLDVALNAQVPTTNVSFHPGDGAAAVSIPLRSYRYAYVASFTNSYVQVIDLDNSSRDKSTFETVVYTLGTPTVPKGNQ